MLIFLLKNLIFQIFLVSLHWIKILGLLLISANSIHCIRLQCISTPNQSVSKQLLNLVGGDDVVCPYCGKHHCHKRADGRWCCSQCNKNFSEKVGTIFENTKIGLRKWFMAMYLISTHKKVEMEF